ncbi:hypothetical protein F4805DRAFT_433483 [Annulohypoxylon moriforme]|nr:hypothetical protein F4805DRAFT_433483 [Annulohypoxylon moriforme]
MPHATKTKKQTRPRVNTAVSVPVQSQQQNRASASSSADSSDSSYVWTAADAARASEAGAFLTAWPPGQPYYLPPIHSLSQNTQPQRRAQNQGQGSQRHHSSTHTPSTTVKKGGSVSK